MSGPGVVRVADRPWTQAPRPVPTTASGWVPDVVIGLAVLVFAVAELLRFSWFTTGELVTYALPGVVTALAVALARHLPGAALALVWATCLLQVGLGLPVLAAQLAVAVVAFGTARWGSRLTVLASLASIPVAGFVFVAAAQIGSIDQILFGSGATSTFLQLYYQLGETWPVTLLVLFTSVLALPWLLGVALRFADRARASRISQEAAEADAAEAHRESDQAHEIARLRDDQARMARDVHDVVGHSLAVILAQAESAQFLRGEERLHETLATIASSARSSLQDVRQVLASTDDTGLQQSAPTADVAALVAGVRSSGYAVEHRELGPVRPLPPELATVAHRVLQEMLTNAMRHGRRADPIMVERHWPDGRWQDELRIEVRNMVDAADGGAVGPDDPTARWEVETLPIAPSDGSGRGVDGMRRRLAAVGGRLDVRLREEDGATSYTATAWVPVRAGAGLG